jgi:hypothetical protein
MALYLDIGANSSSGKGCADAFAYLVAPDLVGITGECNPDVVRYVQAGTNKSCT